MTVLCWNTTWISVHSSDYRPTISLIFYSTFGYFLTEGYKIIIIIIIIIEIIIITVSLFWFNSVLLHDGFVLDDRPEQ